MEEFESEVMVEDDFRTGLEVMAGEKEGGGGSFGTGEEVGSSPLEDDASAITRLRCAREAVRVWICEACRLMVDPAKASARRVSIE